MKRVIVLLLFVFAFVALILLIYFMTPTAKIESSSPKNGEDFFDSSNLKIQLKINKNPLKYFDENSFELSSMSVVEDQNGEVNLDNKNKLSGSFTYEGENITYSLDERTPLAPGTNYKINLKLKNIFGHKEENSIEFKTNSISSSSLTDKQVEQQMKSINILEDGRVKGHEFIKYLPYETDEFLLTYKLDTEKNSITYSVYYAFSKEVVKKEVESWLKSKGAEPNNLNIIYLPYPR